MPSSQGKITEQELLPGRLFTTKKHKRAAVSVGTYGDKVWGLSLKKDGKPGKRLVEAKISEVKAVQLHFQF